jgi:hypothetical protein
MLESVCRGNGVASHGLGRLLLRHSHSQTILPVSLNMDCGQIDYLSTSSGHFRGRKRSATRRAMAWKCFVLESLWREHVVSLLAMADTAVRATSRAGSPVGGVVHVKCATDDFCTMMARC